MKRIFEIIYPDYGGYTFFSIIVWEGVLEMAPAEHIGWNFNLRVMEARFVIQGQIIHHVVEACTTDQHGAWEAILKRAEGLKGSWMKKFGRIKTFDQYYAKQTSVRFAAENPWKLFWKVFHWNWGTMVYRIFKKKR